MEKMLTIKRNVLFVSVFIWLFYTAFYVLLIKKLDTGVAAGYLSLIGEAGLDFIAAFLAFLLWRTSANYKKIFFIFGISFLMAGISDFIYNLVVNIHQTTDFGLLTDSYWDIPFIIFLFLQMGAWFFLFFMNSEKQLAKFLVYIPYILVGFIIFVSFIFGVPWEINYFSTLGVYQVIDTVLEVFGFIFASFCLIRSSILSIRYLSIGYLLVISSDFIIRYSVVTAKLKPGHPLETTWVLGLLLIIIGFFFFCSR